jgi:hypothetical protein
MQAGRGSGSRSRFTDERRTLIDKASSLRGTGSMAALLCPRRSGPFRGLCDQRFLASDRLSQQAVAPNTHRITTLSRIAVSDIQSPWVVWAICQQLTLTQKTVGPTFFGHAENPRYFETAVNDLTGVLVAVS